MMPTTISTYFISVLKQLQATKQLTFFKPENMKPLKMRASKNCIYPQNNNREAYFITSEIVELRNNEKSRRYTLRACNMNTGEITAIGDIGQYSQKGAKDVFKFYCRHIWDGGSDTLKQFVEPCEHP
ncbi:Uncharacterised protein [uncultured archaeon]|nr:Uncharacterised protein [uncultured archaeon]